MTRFHATAALLTVGLIGTASGVVLPVFSYAAQDSAAGRTLPDGTTWYCPMHPEMTSAVTGQCPICKMAMVVGKPLDTREYDLDFSTIPAAVRAGTPFTIKLRVRNGGTQIATSFEEVHDKRYHLFIISRDMSVFEHVHPVQQATGDWALEARLPKPGYYSIVSDFLPTGGAPQIISRWLITADFKGDVESERAELQPDAFFERTLDGMIARVEFDPGPLQAGAHGHLIYSLSDAATGQPITDLQPYLGAFGHTLIMSEDQTSVVHSHPTPDASNDISRGHGGPRIMFEGYFPTAGMYRAWTQFLRHDQITTFSFTFRVPSLEEAMRQAR